MGMMVERVQAYLSDPAGAISTRRIGWLAAASLAIFLALMTMQVSIYDESLVLEGAVEVGLGRVPHRDFFWTYGPAQLWIIAGLFKLFGKSILVARLYDVAVRAAVVFVCGLTARRLGLRPGLVALVMAMETALMVAAGFYLYAVFPSVLCLLAGTLLLIDGGAEAAPRASRLVLAGMLTGMVALLRYDIGFFVLLVHVAMLGFFSVAARQPLRRLAWRVLAYGVGVSIVFVPVAAWGWAVGALPGFLHDMVSFPAANYARMRGLPWPRPGASFVALTALVSYVPFLTSAVGLAWLATRGGRRAAADGLAGRLALVLLVMSTVFIAKGFVRLSMIQMVLALVPGLILLVFLASRPTPRRLWPASVAVFGIASLLLVANLASALHADARLRFGNLLPARLLRPTPADGCVASAILGPGMVDPPTHDAACYLAAHTAPGEAIFVGAGRHDKLFVGNAALYFLSDRPPATHWYHLEPGLQTQAPIQQAMITELAAHDVRTVAIETLFDTTQEPNDSARSSGVHLLDRYLREHYATVASFGTIAILQRRR